MRGPRGELGGSSVCLQSLFDVLHFRFIHNSGILDADFRCGIVSPGRFFDLPRSISQDKKSDFGIFVIKFVGLRISVYRGHFLSWFVSALLPPTHAIYTFPVYAQEKNTLFLCRLRNRGLALTGGGCLWAV